MTPSDSRALLEMADAIRALVDQRRDAAQDHLRRAHEILADAKVERDRVADPLVTFKGRAA